MVATITLAGVTVGASLIAILLLLLTLIVYNNVKVGLALVLATFVYLLTVPEVSASYSGIKIVPEDLLTILLAVVSVIRILNKGPSLSQGLWLGFGGLISVSLFLGISKYGIAPAGNAVRKAFYFWACVAYFSSYEYPRHKQAEIIRWLSAVGALVSIIVVYRWTLDTLGLSGGKVWSSMSQNIPYRVIGATHALFFANLLIIGIHRKIKGYAERYWRFLLPLLMIEILLLQHRSVWMATLVGLTLLIMLAPRKLQSTSSKSAIPSVIGILVAISLLVGGYLDGFTNALVQSIQEATSEESTFVWRLLGWQSLLGQWWEGGWTTRLIGKPFGSGWERYIDDISSTAIMVSPHNTYLNMLLRVGLLGLTVFLGTYTVLTLQLIWKRRTEGAEDPLSTNLLLTLIAMQVVFFVPYGFPMSQAIILGIALSMAEQKATDGAQQNEKKSHTSNVVARQAV